tara:strand:- start:857 stop:1081 length:225 start_codon:yes stop_codon:yes gene_type:complete
MGPKNMVQMQAGDRCVIHTPGGGGWGVPGSEEGENLKAEVAEIERGGENMARAEHVPRAVGSLGAFEELQGGQH